MFSLLNFLAVFPNPAKPDVSEIMDLYGDAILRLAYSYLHNSADAQDILQETLIRYHHKGPQFESDEKLKAWLLTVCANLSRNMLVKRKIFPVADIYDQYEFLVNEDNDLSFVWQAVKSLDVKYREVIHLYYVEGYKSDEIAQILHKNEATVRSLLARGRQKLKNILKEDYDFE